MAECYSAVVYVVLWCMWCCGVCGAVVCVNSASADMYHVCT